MNKKWKAFEKLATKIQSALSPNAIIKTNQKILGQISKIKREIDI